MIGRAEDSVLLDGLCGYLIAIFGGHMLMTTLRRCLVLTATATVFGASGLGAQQTTPITSPLHTGAWIVGGSANVGHNTGALATTFVQVSPTALALVTPNFAIGGVGTIGYSSNDNGHQWTYGLGPSARLFLGDASSLTLPFISGSFIPQWNKTHIESSSLGSFTGDESSHQYLIDGSVGVTRMIASHVGLTGEAYLSHFEFSTDLPTGSTVNSSQNQYGLRVGLTAFVR
jgi:hypothetical protein